MRLRVCLLRPKALPLYLLLFLPALPLLLLYTSPLLTSPTISSPSESDYFTTSYEPESQNNMDQPSDDVLNASLYHNASISLVTSLLLIMSFALKHNLTDAALQDLLQLISYFIPKPNICVTSLHSFKKTFNATQLKSTCFHYCKSSLENMLTLQCPLCGTDQDSKSYFISLCIKEQLQNLFGRPGFFTAIQHRFSRNTSPEVIGDVYDGALYNALFSAGGFLSSACNISFQWNTDGVSLFPSSSYSMWPMYLKINKLPQRMRNSLNNKILAGVWFGSTKPSINTFLKPLCQAMKELYSLGVEVHPPDLQCPLVCRTGTCDLPAKAANTYLHARDR